jgi:hypothetical protein
MAAYPGRGAGVRPDGWCVPPQGWIIERDPAPAVCAKLLTIEIIFDGSRSLHCARLEKVGDGFDDISIAARSGMAKRSDRR